MVLLVHDLVFLNHNQSTATGRISTKLGLTAWPLNWPPDLSIQPEKIFFDYEKTNLTSTMHYALWPQCYSFTFHWKHFRTVFGIYLKYGLEFYIFAVLQAYKLGSFRCVNRCLVPLCLISAISSCVRKKIKLSLFPPFLTLSPLCLLG